jgi:hypothetical protein
MVPPLLWLVSDAAKVTGRRFLGVHWDAALPLEQAAEKSGAPVAWTSIATALMPHLLCHDAYYALAVVAPSSARSRDYTGRATR